VQGRIGSPTNTQYDGSGDYKIRLRRYTSGGGNTASEANSSTVSIVINLPTPTPTLTPTDTPTPTLVPTDAPTNTPTPTTKPTSIPTLKPSLKPTSKPSPSIPNQLISTEAGVLGESSESSEIQISEMPQKEIRIASEKNNNLLPRILILIGIVFLVACAIVIFYPYLKNLWKKNPNE
jgi:hypothetical protein